MKQEFSTQWISSKQVRKQRKYIHNAPLHLRRKFLNSNLSRDLREKHGRRNLTIRKGDEILIMRGNFAKKKGKVLEVDMKKGRVTIDGISRKKGDGTKVNVYFYPSSLQIQALNLEDGKRFGKKKVKKAKPEENKEKA